MNFRRMSMNRPHPDIALTVHADRETQNSAMSELVARRAESATERGSATRQGHRRGSHREGGGRRQGGDQRTGSTAHRGSDVVMPASSTPSGVGTVSW
ncbi:hypothetical protein K7B10_34920 [Streptomyces flavotricini]|uniref:Uncharacterized protein n=1 Tax=Streptomyces flavotricini TaxID=66888 RepID=A0ABS8EFW0_9ACTN|nr:hypothetical protein [Streptomyces flavotricini]MCC0099887.1 hypothetical protein [Streptomyces flavotricini]